MSEMQENASTASPAAAVEESIPIRKTGWAGWVVFASTMLVLVGLFQTTVGLIALFKEDYHSVPSGQLAVTISYSTWGWAHLLIGVIAILAGIGLLNGATWARVLGVGVGIVSAFVSFLFTAAFPVWGIVLMTLNVIVIYAITLHGGEMKDA
jgi:hypothetical protein